MLTLATTNPAKYAPFAGPLERWRISIEPPKEGLPELQSTRFEEVLEAKARAAAAMFGRRVLIDDTGIVLEAYHPFPGPLTSSVVRGLGGAGLERLLAGVTKRASFECHLGCWVDGALRHWRGAVPGRLDFSRQPRDARMPLTDWFVPDEAVEAEGRLPHRARALAALEADLFGLHLDTTPEAEAAACPRQAHYECPFCAEFESDGLSIFAQMMGERLASRVVYEDEHFVVMPPLGEFMPGGLLLLTREHILSLAHLRPELIERLGRLVEAISQALAGQWGVPPLVFEHGPAPDRSKGLCCVDHAHLNIFPAPIHVHPRLLPRMHLPLNSLADLPRLRRAEFGYLLVRENDGTLRAYDAQGVPTQLVRRIVTAGIGLPERWHWRDYPGYDELIQTYNALKGRIQL